MSTLQTFGARLKNLLLPLASCVLVAAVIRVQSSVFPATIEQTVRPAATVLGLVAVPALLALAFQEWRANHRAQLSPWRNGLALSSVVVLFAVWMLYWGMWLIIWAKPVWSRSLGGIEWIALLLHSSVIGLLLSFALRGAPRAQVISASLLMFASVQASIHF